MKTTELLCNKCGKSFLMIVKYYNQKIKNGQKEFYCSRNCFIDNVKRKPIKKIFLYCHKEFDSTTFKDAKNCCSNVCSSRYSQSFVNKDNISKSMKRFWKNNPQLHKKTIPVLCIFCKAEFIPNGQEKCCSIECRKNKMRLNGLLSVQVQKENRRSKNEIYFAELCKKHFQNVEFNIPKFNGWDCDVILNDQKVAVMWNGKWHYEKITRKHSVNQVQNRDKIKLNEIIKCGYTPYVIKDLGREDNVFVESEFKKFTKFLLTDCKNGI